MPRRDDIETILIIGAGPIVIGQACEFDYSGVQAIKALKREGYRVVLVNSNPATLMTDPELADATYIEPIRPDFVEEVVRREKPDALLPTMGGQTALNCALALDASGALARAGVELIGARSAAIEMAEDRQSFAAAMARIGLSCPRSESVTAPTMPGGDFDRLQGLHMAMSALERIGLPAIIRPAFTLGGEGGGVAFNRSEFETLARGGLQASPRAQILIDENLLGWKEFELEVVRDVADNAIIVCSIENVDPMGVHTGDSITVAPAMTLTDREYQQMRDSAFAVIREIGVETGGANVQFAVDPETGRQVVIEMNPRVSRSSALASKATGFPIAKIAALLAVGYTLDELENEITRATPASFEPVLDYVVTKIPRFAFEKYRGSDPVLTTSMKSVGEAMAIGRSFPESLQKALRSLETGLSGLDETATAKHSRQNLFDAIASPSPDRLRLIADLFRAGATLEDIHARCRIDPWFLRHLHDIVAHEAGIRQRGLPRSAEEWRATKSFGFSDARLARLTGQEEAQVRALRHGAGVRPLFRRIDTCAGEFRAPTPYLYSSYEAGSTDTEPASSSCEADPEDADKAIIVGGGPNRIGQGLEFDYCCCHAAFAVADAGWRSVMINCNPETVSTDYDTSDRLYFEPLALEDVLEIVHRESEAGHLHGVIVQFGGQTPLKLAPGLAAAGIPILGTSVDSLDEAEDRGRFAELLERIGLRQAASRVVRDAGAVTAAANALGYPVMLRPSNVLGGRAMEIARDESELRAHADAALGASEGGALLIDRFLDDAVEIDVDALCDGKRVLIAGVMEHIEEAGVHSGDSACALPAYSLDPEVSERLCQQTRLLALALKVRGLINVQFAVRDGDIFVLEANPRASRTVPFVAKAVGRSLPRIAAALMMGRSLDEFGLMEGPLPVPRQAVKEAVFPFARFPGTDPALGPEMRSTGEAMGTGRDFGAAYLKSQIAAGTDLPREGNCLLSVRDGDKLAIANIAACLAELGFSLLATDGTCRFLRDRGLKVKRVNKRQEGRPNVVDLIGDGEVHLVVNTTQGARSLADSALTRQSALRAGVPYYTTLGGGRAALAAIKASQPGPFDIDPLQSYLPSAAASGAPAPEHDSPVPGPGKPSA